MALSGLSVRDRFRPILPDLPRSDQPELMDGPDLDPIELAGNLRDIRRVNRLLGGSATILRHLPSLLDRIPATRPATLLDLATGSADIPLAISRWAKRKGNSLTIVASDCSATMLNVARQQICGHAKITLAQYDARAVPLSDDSFDVVLCSLSLHHFSPGDAVLVLREMDRLARYGFILNDLRRDRLGFAAAWLASRATSRNRLTRNDAPLSILRAYTPDELDELLRQAGVDSAEISTHPWFRMAAVKTTVTHHA